MSALKVLEKSNLLGGELTIYGDCDKPFFLAKDVADWIQHKKVDKMIQRLPNEDKITQTVIVNNKEIEVITLTETGVYKVLSYSRKDVAKEFKQVVENYLLYIRHQGEKNNKTKIRENMNNELRIFSNPSFGNIRVGEKDGEPMFCLIDIARALGYNRPSDAVTSHCKGVSILPTPTQNQHGATVMQNIKFGKESEIFRLVMKSKLPEAEQFQDWVCEEVLPSIRKNGAYLTQNMVDEVLLNPDTIIQLATQLKEERAQKEMLLAQTEQQTKELRFTAPKVEYFDNVLQSTSTYQISLIAKELGMGAEKLNQALKDCGVQYKLASTWVLTAKYQGRDLTKTKTHSFTKSDGTTGTSMLTVWTEKGRLFIHSLRESGKI